MKYVRLFWNQDEKAVCSSKTSVNYFTRCYTLEVFFSKFFRFYKICSIVLEIRRERNTFLRNVDELFYTLLHLRSILQYIFRFYEICNIVFEPIESIYS